MRNVFLSHSFHERDKQLVNDVELLLRSHGLVATNGRVLGGGPLTDQIREFITNADGLIALLTIREDDPPNVTHPWVIEEFSEARGMKKPSIGMYETGVPKTVFDSENERILYDSRDPLAAMLKLSSVIGHWRRQAGRLLKIQLMPPEVARQLGSRAERVTCEFRFLVMGNEADWQTAKIVREVGGVFALLRVPEDVESIRLRASGAGIDLDSAYTQVSIPITLDPRTS